MGWRIGRSTWRLGVGQNWLDVDGGIGWPSKSRNKWLTLLGRNVLKLGSSSFWCEPTPFALKIYRGGQLTLRLGVGVSNF